MKFSIREIQICGRSNYCFTDDEHPQIAVLTEGGSADEILIRVKYGETEVWRKNSSETYLLYDGEPLKPKSRYEVIVQAEKKGQTAEKTAVFDTGFMGNAWDAAWIEPVQEPAEAERRIRFFETFLPGLRKEFYPEKLKAPQQIRRRFTLEKVPSSAVLYATAHGVYRLLVNGKDADGRRLAPEISVYHKQLYYQRYELAPLLREGENEVLFILADGWWCGRIGLTGDSCQYGNRLALLAELDTPDPADPGILRPLWGSDGQFTGCPSDAQYADLYIGEKWDLTRKTGSSYPCLAQEPAEEGSVSGSYRFANLRAQELAPLEVTGSIPGRLFISPSGELLADFGQTLAGVVHLQADLAEETTLSLEHCEALSPEGNFFQNIVGRNKQQQDIITAPAGALDWEGHYTYHGFRYVRITGISREEIRGIEARVIGTPLTFTGNFTCSVPEIDQLQHNITWSMKSNFFSIPTDCPQREKMGWTGDIQIFADTALENADVRGFLENWLGNMRLEQREDGMVPNYVPAFPINAQTQEEAQHDNTSSAWGDACILVPLSIYKHTGDLSVLRDNLPMMEKWLDFIRSRCAVRPENYEELTPAQKARLPYLWHAGHHYGDWLIPSLADQRGGPKIGMEATGKVISSSFYAITLEAMGQVLQALLQEKEAGARSALINWQAELAEIQNLLGKVRKAVREEYISDDGRVKGDYQGLYVIVLKAGIPEGDLRKKVAARLAEKIRENGTHLDTGFVTTPYLLEILCENGYEELAFELLMQDTAPSWLYQVKMGATTIWENWNAIRPDGSVTEASMNHYALGSAGSWIYRHIGGLAEVNPAEEEVRIELHPRVLRKFGFTHAACTRQTPAGTISFRWSMDPACNYSHQQGEIYYELESPYPSRVIIQ